jgi:FtsH-binding integral membrane protein
MDVLNQFQNLMNNRLDTRMKGHLQKVYGCIASASIVAAAGSACHVNGIWEGGILSGLGSLILMMMLAFSRNPEGKDDVKRFAYLNGLAFCTGLSTGPLIDHVWNVIDPSLVISALLYTCVIFTCFSLSALFATEGKFLALGAPIMSIMSTLLISSLLNMFIRSHTIAYIHLLLGLGLMSAFILYDTHLIMEKVRMGDMDYIWHSLTLFIDLASLFKHILVLLADKEQSNRSRNKRSSR